MKFSNAAAGAIVWEIAAENPQLSSIRKNRRTGSGRPLFCPAVCPDWQKIRFFDGFFKILLTKLKFMSINLRIFNFFDH